MGGVEVANAFVTIEPSFRGIASKLSAGLDGPSEKAGRQAGEKAGKQLGNGIEKAARQSGEKAGDAIGSGIESKLRGVGSGIGKVISTALLAAGLKKSIDAASDLNETLSKSKVIFGDAASGFEDIANSAAKTMGLSKRAYLDSAAGLKGLLDNLGLANSESVKWSKSMTQLGADLASFFNADPAEAVEAIGSALRGESEPIRRFNVNLNEAAVKAKAMALGLYDGKGAIEQSAKAQATLALIMEQTSTAQGDFARTADGVANSQRTAAAEAENAAASFGQALLPVYQRVIQVATKLAQGFASLPSGLQVGIVAVGGLVALSGPIGGMVSTIGKLGGALKGLGGAGGGLSAISKIGLGVSLATAAVGVGLAIWERMGEKQREVAARSKEVATALPAQVSETWKLADASAGASGKVDGLAVANIALSKSLVQNGDDGAKLTQALGALGFQTTDTLDVLRQIKADGSAGIASIGRQAGLTAQEASLMAKALADTNGNIDDVATSFTYFATKVGGGTKGMKLSSAAAEAMWKNIKPLVEAMGELEGQAKKTDLDQVAKQYLTTAAASSEAADAAIRQAEADTQASRAGEGALNVYMRYQEILAGKTAAERAAILGTKDLTDATAGLKTVAAGTLRVMGKTVTAFDRAATAASGFADAIDRVSGPAGDLEESNRRIRENAADLAQAWKDNGTSLDINTEKGRANREEIQKSIEGLRDHATAMIKNGASAEQAAAFVNYSTEALVGNTVGMEKNKDKAAVLETTMREYLETLGATPAEVETAIQLQHDEEAKARVQDLISKLGDIPEVEATTIQALIDAGKFAAAEAALNRLARNRSATVNFTITGPGAAAAIRSGGGGVFSGWKAAGVVVDRPTILGAGEAGPEAILPLTNPARMRALVSDPRVLGPVSRAMPGGVGHTVNFYGPVNNPGEVEAAVARALRLAAAQPRFAS